MKLSVLRSSLAKALSKASSVTGSRSTLPVLGNVLLEAKDGKLTITGTDLEVRVEIQIDAAIEREGITTLPAKKLTQLVNLCPAEMINIDVNAQNHAQIDAGSANYLLYGLSPEDFPTPVDAPIIREFNIKQSELMLSIIQVAYAVNEEESRRILKGVLFSIKGGHFITVGTDGKRLALVDKTIEEHSGAEGDSVIPLRSADALKTILDKTGDVKVKMSEKHAEFEFTFDTGSQCRMMCKLLEGTYPNFRQVIPKSFQMEISIPTKAFQSALERVSLATGSENPTTKLVFADNQLNLEAHSDSFGNGSDIVALEYTATPLTMQLNTRFINEPFRHTTADAITLRVNDGASPILLESTEGFLSVIMPIRPRPNE